MYETEKKIYLLNTGLFLFYVKKWIFDMTFSNLIILQQRTATMD